MTPYSGTWAHVDPYEPPTSRDFLRYAEDRRRDLARELAKLGTVRAQGADWAGWPVLWVAPIPPVIQLRVLVGVLWLWWDRPPWRENNTRDRYPITRSDQPREAALIIDARFQADRATWEGIRRAFPVLPDASPCP
jgi:hypothetical protein